MVSGRFVRNNFGNIGLLVEDNGQKYYAHHSFKDGLSLISLASCIERSHLKNGRRIINGIAELSQPSQIPENVKYMCKEMFMSKGILGPLISNESFAYLVN